MSKETHKRDLHPHTQTTCECESLLECLVTGVKRPMSVKRDLYMLKETYV